MKSVQTTVRAAILMALCTLGAGAALAAEASPSAAISRSTTVSLAGLDLSTSAGIVEARKRLHQAARAACSRVSDSLDLSHQTNFLKCVDESLTNALQQLNHPSRMAINQSSAAWRTTPGAPGSDQSAVKAAETRVKTASLSDLDLATPEGVRAANQRVHEVARTLCTQLKDLDDLSKHDNFVKCVDDAVAASLPKIEQLARFSRSKNSVAKN